jgi:hypothetical protein
MTRDPDLGSRLYCVAVAHDAVKLCEDCRWCRVEGPWQLPGGPLPARHWCDQPQLLLPARPDYGAGWDANPLAGLAHSPAPMNAPAAVPRAAIG